MDAKVKVKPGNFTTQFVEPDIYFLATVEHNYQLLPARDFWTLATPFYDFAIIRPEVIFEIEVMDWTVMQFEWLMKVVNSLPNVKII